MFDWITRFRSAPEDAATSRAATAPCCDESSEACKNRGNQHFARGELDAAAECYRQAIAIDPTYAEAHNNLGLVALKQKRLDQAAQQFSVAIALSPRLANAHYNLGNLYDAQGKLDSAIKAYCSAIESKPDMIVAYGALSSALCRCGKHGVAIAQVQEGIAINPDSPELQIELGELFLQEDRLEEAASCFRTALVQRPGHTEEILSKLASIFRRQGKLDEAIVTLQRLLSVSPTAANHVSLGDAFVERGDLDDALACYRNASVLAPNDAQVRSYTGVVLQLMDHQEAASTSFHQAAALRPGYGPLLYNLCLSDLMAGRLTEAWGNYESRFADNVSALRRCFPHPEWNGSDLDGKSLLVWGEQGIGDEILFANMFPDIIAGTKRCIIECAPKLVPLFANSFQAAEVVPRSTPPHPATLNGVDVHCAAGSLARWLRPSIDSFPSNDRYLAAKPARASYWQKRIAGLGPGLKIGFSWTSHKVTGMRSLYYTGLDQWGPIFAVRGVHFISLQHSQCSDELAAASQRFGIPLHVFNEVDLFDDLAEAAALKKALDLVISAPTATAFLSAALGVPTWMMSYTKPWQTLGTDHVPWFPAMRCFPRRWDQSWEEVIDGIADQLRGELLADRAPEQP